MYRIPLGKHLFVYRQYCGVDDKMLRWLMKNVFLAANQLRGLLSAEICISMGICVVQ